MSGFPLLLSTDELDELLSQASSLQVIDCQADLMKPVAGEAAWREGHIPGAVHLDLERDLSGPVNGWRGRHPLPDPNRLLHTLEQKGISSDHPIVVYDNSGGAFAARAWWLLRWLGHAEVALLDGGLSAWQAAGGVLSDDRESPEPAVFRARPGAMPLVETKAVEQGLGDGEMRLIDARSVERFLGEEEPIDSVAGHIPGAVNLPFAENLDSEGFWRSPKDLKGRFGSVLPPFTPAETAHMCGSGVTACHNLFAMELAGLSGSALYAGSWSEWIREVARPVARAEG